MKVELTIEEIAVLIAWHCTRAEAMDPDFKLSRAGAHKARAERLDELAHQQPISSESCTPVVEGSQC